MLYCNRFNNCIERPLNHQSIYRDYRIGNHQLPLVKCCVSCKFLARSEMPPFHCINKAAFASKVGPKYLRADWCYRPLHVLSPPVSPSCSDVSSFGTVPSPDHSFTTYLLQGPHNRLIPPSWHLANLNPSTTCQRKPQHNWTSASLSLTSFCFLS